MTEIHIQLGDITECDVDAVVNAANNDLILGGGLAGAIARKGGPEIQAQCRQRGPIKIDEAAITTAGNLSARYIIHAASMRLGGTTSAENLQASVRHTLALAEQYHLQTIAFPAIGTGIARFPIDQCAEIMLKAVYAHIQSGTNLKKVFFVLFDEHSYKTFKDAYNRVWMI